MKRSRRRQWFLSNVLADGDSQPGAGPETARVFFALWLPGEVAQRLVAVADDYAKHAGGRVARCESVHLTLAFLGAVATERVPDLQRVAGIVRAAAFDLTLDRFGVWPHNRLFWAGCTATPPALADLSSSLIRELQRAGFAVADARRRFVPHVTLVRKVAMFGSALPAGEPRRWHCDRFVLLRSQWSAAGSVYRVLGEFPLAETFTP